MELKEYTPPTYSLQIISKTGFRNRFWNLIKAPFTYLFLGKVEF